MNEILINVAVPVVTGLIGWLSARRKNRAETQISEIDAVERAVKVWRELSEDLQKRQDEFQKKIDLMSGELESLRSENRSLKAELNRLKQSH